MLIEWDTFVDHITWNTVISQKLLKLDSIRLSQSSYLWHSSSTSSKTGRTSVAKLTWNPNRSKNSFCLAKQSSSFSFLHPPFCLPALSWWMNNERSTRFNDITEVLCLQQINYMNEVYRKVQAEIVAFIMMAVMNDMANVAKCSLEKAWPLQLRYALCLGCVHAHIKV